MNTKNILKFIDSRKVAFIGSIDENGFPNIKAMLPPRKREGLTFFFTTNTSSLRVKQYRNNPNASIYFYRKGLFIYTGIMMIGTMEVLEDQESKDMIWKKGDTMYYKEGVTDPDYCVLKFTAKSMRMYRDLHTENIDISDYI